MVVQPAERAVQPMRQLLRGAMHRLLERRSVVSHRHRLPAFETGLQHAAMVMLTALVAVLVAQVNFHPGDMFTEALRRR